MKHYEWCGRRERRAVVLQLENRSSRPMSINREKKVAPGIPAPEIKPDRVVRREQQQQQDTSRSNVFLHVFGIGRDTWRRVSRRG